MAGLKLFHANKIYDGGVHALKDFCLDVDDGKFVVFVGPSGCGKSTALRMIAGLEKITSGDIYIGDRLVNGLPPKERNIAMVFQSYALFPNMSVYDNISFGLRMHGEDKAVIKEKVEWVADMLNLTDYLKRKPSQLSGGQKQRVALGRAIVRNPDIFLLDEPLSNLDAKLRAKMRSEILALHNRLKATFVYVTHDQTEAMTMGDIIVVMRDGCIMQTGSPKQLYRYPENKFVASFLGSPQMNFWDGTLKLEGDTLVASTQVGDFPLEGELRLRFDEDAIEDGRGIIVGLRPEDIYTYRKKTTDIELNVPIDVVEELCTHTVLHGKINDSEVVGYGISGENPLNQTLTLYADISKLHVFDGESENVLMPQYSPKKTVKAIKKADKLQLLGGSVQLSAQQADGLDDGELEVVVPTDAFIDGNIPLATKRVLSTRDGDVSIIRAGGEDIFAKGDFSQRTSFGLDVSRLELKGSRTVDAIKEQSKLLFTYQRRKEKEGKQAILKHFLVFDRDIETEAFYDFNKKMYRLGKSIFRNTYALYLTTKNVRLARENESYPTLEAYVESVVDYGQKQYSVVTVGAQRLYVEGALVQGERALLAIDLDNARVGVCDEETILF